MNPPKATASTGLVLYLQHESNCNQLLKELCKQRSFKKKNFTEQEHEHPHAIPFKDNHGLRRKLKVIFQICSGKTR